MVSLNKILSSVLSKGQSFKDWVGHVIKFKQFCDAENITLFACVLFIYRHFRWNGFRNARTVSTSSINPTGKLCPVPSSCPKKLSSLST